MPRPRKSTEQTAEQIRNELFAELNEPDLVPKKHPAVKNIYNYHPDCPYADRNTGIVLESIYQYWRFYPKDKIEPGEVIRHMNNDRTDNRIENLVKVINSKIVDSPIPNYMVSIKQKRV